MLSRIFTMSNNFLGLFSHFLGCHTLSRTFEGGSRMNHTVHFRHSNVSNCIEILSFFQHRSDNNMFSVKWKLSVKSLDKKCQAFRDLGKGILNKDVPEKYRLPRKIISTWVENKWKYFLLEILQRFKSLHVHEVARKQSRILTYFTENKYQFL